MRKHTHQFGRTGWLRAIAFAIVAAAGPAHAVDIVNNDKVLRVVVLNEDTGDSNVVTIPPKQKFNNVCRSCVVLLGDMTAEAEGEVTVVIERGKLSLAKKK